MCSTVFSDDDFIDECLDHMIGGFLKKTTRMKVYIINVLKDNYSYIVADDNFNGCLIDCIEPQKIEKTVNDNNIVLKACFITHHHWDHSEGTAEFKQIFNVPIYGGDDRIEEMTKKLIHDEIIKIGSLSIKSIHTPCHTTDHLCYYITDDNSEDSLVFTGDTLFIGGCGKFFEGTVNEMVESFCKLEALPLKTKVYCGHEYSVKNYAFARHIWPSNNVIKSRYEEIKKLVETKSISVPSTIQKELETNIFFQTRNIELQNILQTDDHIATFAKLRALKDQY